MAALWFSISFIWYVSFIKIFPNGPPYRLRDAYHLFFLGVEVLCISYSVHIVYTIVKSIDAMQKKHHDKAYLKMRKAMAIPTAVAMSPSMTSHLGRFKA